MKEIIKYGVARLPKEFIGTESEKTNFPGVVAGDKFYTEDANGMVAGHVWNGQEWKVFERYEY